MMKAYDRIAPSTVAGFFFPFGAAPEIHISPTEKPRFAAGL